MRQFDQAGSLGALLLGSALLGYAIYEEVLWPNAGFPTNEIEVILAGASTLRIGHWLKFVDAIALALLVVAMHARLRQATPVLAQLAAIGGASAATLFLASGMLGLRILAVAELTYPVNPAEAVTTIFLRTVTVALFDAAVSAAGFFGLLFSLGGLLSGRLPQTVYVPDLWSFDLTVGVRNIVGQREEVPAQEDYDRTDPEEILLPVVPGEGREVYARLGYRY